jgi:hypothetical protein
MFLESIEIISRTRIPEERQWCRRDEKRRKRPGEVALARAAKVRR